MESNLLELEGMKEVYKLFGPEKFSKAHKRAMKKGLDKAYTVATKQLTSTWNVKKKDLKPLIKKTIAYSDPPTGYLTVKSRPLSMRYFGAKKYAKGMSVKIKKKTTKKIDTFEATGLKGKNRTQKAGYGWVSKTSPLQPRKRKLRKDAKVKRSAVRPRLDITFLRVITVASMFKQGDVYKPTAQAALIKWEQEFIRQIAL